MGPWTLTVLDEHVKTISGIVSRKQSMLQAWYVVWNLFDEAMKKEKRRVA